MWIQRRVLVAAVSAGVLAVGLGPTVSTSPAGAAPFNVKHLNKIQSRLISGELLATLGGKGVRTNLVPGGGDEDQDHGADGAANTPPDSIGPSVGQGDLPANLAPTGTGECSQRLGSNVKVNQNCLNVSDPDLQGRGQANNESVDLAGPVRPQPHRRQRQRLRPRGRHLRLGVLSRPRTDVERLDRPGHLHPRRLEPTRASTGRPAATRPSPGTRAATRTCPVSCSIVAGRVERP